MCLESIFFSELAIKKCSEHCDTTTDSVAELVERSTAKDAKGTKVVDNETFLPRIHTDLTNENKQLKVPTLDSAGRNGIIYCSFLIGAWRTPPQISLIIQIPLQC
jgi:hypothetical protein